MRLVNHEPSRKSLKALLSGKPNSDEEEGGFMGRSDVSNRPVYQNRSKRILRAAAALSLLAALIHLWVMPEHFEEWWGYGTFFLISATAQGFYGAALLRWPRRPLLLLGIGGNLSIIVLYLLTRTVGIPFFGPGAGEVEGVGVADLWATTSELALVSLLVALLLKDLPRERVIVFLFVLALTGLFFGHLLHLILSVSPVR